MPISPSFNVRFNLNGSPTIVLTDTTVSAPAGMVGYFDIVQPDGYVRYGNPSATDVVAGGSLTVVLRLDSDGKPQCGSYKITYTVVAPGYMPAVFVREFVFDFDGFELDVRKSFDVFTPELKFFDDTVYAVPGYTTSSTVRAWNATSAVTGLLQSSLAYIDLKKNNKYYDSLYTVSLQSVVTYASVSYPWLSVVKTVSSSVSAQANTPPSINSIIGWIDDVKKQLNESINNCAEYDELRSDFEFIQTSFSHIADKFKAGLLDGLTEDFETLLAKLNKYRNYVNTNLEILPYSYDALLNVTEWGRIIGDIQDQTDLILYIASKIDSRMFTATIGDGTATTYNVAHGLSSKNVMVTVYETATGGTVYTDVTRADNVVTIGFSKPPTNGAYKVLIFKVA